MAKGDSLAEQFPRLLVELQDEFEWDSKDPKRFVYAKMRMAAETALANGMRTAAYILDAARVMRESDKATGDT